MTPAIAVARRAKIAHRIHEYAHDPSTASFGEEAARCLGLSPAQVFKTLIAKSPAGELLMGIVPVSGQLDLKALAAAAGLKKLGMAPVEEAERATGYLAGGISPLGQKKRLRAFLDESAVTQEEIWISAGRRGLEISLGPEDLREVLEAVIAPLARA